MLVGALACFLAAQLCEIGTYSLFLLFTFKIFTDDPTPT